MSARHPHDFKGEMDKWTKGQGCSGTEEQRDPAEKECG